LYFSVYFLSGPAPAPLAAPGRPMAYRGKIVHVNQAQGLIRPEKSSLKYKTVRFAPTPFCRNVGDDVAFNLDAARPGFAKDVMLVEDAVGGPNVDFNAEIPFTEPDLPLYSHLHRVLIGKVFGQTEEEQRFAVRLLTHLHKAIKEDLDRHAEADTQSHLVAASNTAFPNFIMKLFEHLEMMVKGPELMAAAKDLKVLVNPTLTFKQTFRIEGWANY